jgi:sulfatase maturation enzyme AslB (radical SAM superfamily)
MSKLLPVIMSPMKNWLPDIRYVQVATHSRCNADCVFCPYSESEHFKHPGMMRDETWHLILSNLRPWSAGLKKFCPYLMQEPLIDKTIFAKIADIYRCFPKIAVEVSTNGAALTEKTVVNLFELFENRNHEIWVSHHGIDKETMEHIMAIDYDKSTENLIRLLKMSNGRYKIRIRGAGRSKAVDKVYFTHEQYIAYWEEMFARYSINRRNVSIDSFEFHDRAASLFREDRGSCNLNKGKVRDIGPGHKEFSCSRIDEWVHFMHDGSMRICCMDYHHEIKLPNIHQMSLLDYFHSDEYRELVNKVSGRIESEENFICKRCTSPGG